ncbi:sigma-70 family RNA polymerase sigma factor [Pelomonas sp. SE-A7]|uniref:RNA polymerase sigma factor n=1 Tax=Pelomonas sp. SE-A7 TaxID=3054953 RepID=UPI00259C7631|nr:sigma-70 family RNA polymerase sigma factor [Pelomonas sp. SE-A7]MDM4766646.1 sigma-70 family RNA polymerase sigma factor [Pelomonas sp. SE-A7]
MDAGLRQGLVGVELDDVSDWFVREVLPLEGVIERYLRSNWRNADEIADLRQEVYTRVFDACTTFRPESTQAFVLTTARNLLIDQARRAQVVSFESYAEIDSLPQPVDELGPERHAAGRSALRFLQSALEKLPERCRMVVQLRKIDEMSQREVAARMGITEDTVERQVSKGVRALADAMAAVGQEVGGRAGARASARKRTEH